MTHNYLTASGLWRSLSPVIRAGYLVEADARSCAEAIISERQRPFIQFEPVWHLPPPTFDIEGHIDTLSRGLERLFPLAAVDATRYLVSPTISRRWSRIFFNNGMHQLTEFMAGLNRHVNGRVIYFYDLEHSLKKEGANRYIGHYGGIALWLFASGQPFEPDRTITLVRDTSGWKFHQYGRPLPFENTTLYQLPRKKDRFSGAILRQYLKDLAIDPFDLSSYDVSSDSPAIMVSQRDVPPDTKFLDLETIERQWYKELAE